MIIYPNPVRNVLLVQMSKQVDGRTNLRIQDKIGRTVLQYNNLNIEGNESRKIDVDHLLMGQYTAQLIGQDGQVIASHRMVKQ